MSVTPALTSDELDALLGPSTVLRYLSPVPDTVVATARINQVSFIYPLVQLTVDGTSAGWSSVREGMTVYVGTLPGGTERGIYRVRQAGNSTTIYLQEMGSQDAGLLAVDIRTAGFANDDYVTVVERFDMWAVSPRIDVEGNAIYEDYDDSVGSSNTTPENLVEIKVNGRRNHLAHLITGSSFTFSIVATGTKWPTSSGSSVTHSWAYPAAFTGVSGSSTNTLTASAPPGNYTVYYTQHDSIGGDTLRIIHVNIHHPTLNPPVLISEMPKSDSRDRTGRRMSFDLYNDRLTQLVNGGMVIYFEVCTWDGLDVPTATRQFVGWVQRETHQGSDGLRQASLEIIGPAGLLGMMGSTSQIITATASPASWQQCVPSLASASFMCFYMLRRRAANVLRLFDLTVFSTDPVGQRKPEWIIDKGSLLSQMQSLATERGNFGANSEGSLFFLRHPSLLNYDDGSRDNVVIRDELDASLYARVTVQVEKQRKVQQVRGEAFTWDGAAELPTAMYSDSPKVVAQGSSQTKMPSLVVASQAELEQITGDGEAQQNNKYPQIDILIQKNRDVYEPAEMQFASVIVPDYLAPLDEEWIKNGIPLSVTKTHNPDGTSDINLSLEGETHNIKGDYVAVPDGNDTTFASPDMPSPEDPLPLPGGLGEIAIPGAVLPTDPLSSAPSVTPGRAAIRNTASNAYCTYDIRPGAPDWAARNVPSWFTVISMMVHDEGEPFSRGAYLIGNDGTDSRVAYTPDVYEITPVWTLGDTVTGIWNMIESVKDVPGKVLIKGSAVGSPTTVSFLSGDGPGDWTEVVFDPLGGGCLATVIGTYNSGSDRFEAAYCATASGKLQKIILPLGTPSTITSIEIDVDYDSTIPFGAPFYVVALYYDGALIDSHQVNPPATGTYTLTFSAPATGVSEISINTSAFTNPGDGHSYITAIRMNYALGVSATIVSEDYGDTLGTPRSIAGGLSGMSVGVLGISTIVGNGAKASITNDHDGVGYRDADHGEATGTYPIALLIPTYRLNSTSLSNKGINPNYLMAFPALVSGDSLVQIKGVGRSAISPSISGTKALGVTPLGLDSWKGKRIYFIGSVSGTRYLFMTKDTGTHWSYTAMANAASVRARRYSSNGYEALAAAGSDGLKYTSNGGVSWSTKTASGTNLFAQLFG